MFTIQFPPTTALRHPNGKGVVDIDRAEDGRPKMDARGNPIFVEQFVSAKSFLLLLADDPGLVGEGRGAKAIELAARIVESIVALADDATEVVLEHDVGLALRRVAEESWTPQPRFATTFLPFVRALITAKSTPMTQPSKGEV